MKRFVGKQTQEQIQGVAEKLPGGVIILQEEDPHSIRFLNAKILELLSSLELSTKNILKKKIFKVQNEDETDRVFSLKDLFDPFFNLPPNRFIKVEGKAISKTVEIYQQNVTFDKMDCRMFLIIDASILAELNEERRIKDDIQQAFSCVQHETKNCLNLTLQFCELLLKTVSAEESKFVQLIKDSTNLLSFSVADWLDSMVVGSTNFVPKLTSVDIPKAITEVQQLCEVKALNKDVTVRMSGLEGLPMILNTDKVRLQQVLLNLISNAIKYSPQKTMVKCDLQYSETD